MEEIEPASIVRFHRAQKINDPDQLWRFMPQWVKHHMRFSKLPEPNKPFDMRQYIPGLGYMDKWPKIPGITLAMPIQD